MFFKEGGAGGETSFFSKKRGFPPRKNTFLPEKKRGFLPEKHTVLLKKILISPIVLFIRAVLHFVTNDDGDNIHTEDEQDKYECCGIL